MNKLEKPTSAVARQRASSRNLSLLTSQVQGRSKGDKSVVHVLLCWRKASPRWLWVRISLPLLFLAMRNPEVEKRLLEKFWFASIPYHKDTCGPAIGDDTGSVIRGANTGVSSHMDTILPSVWDSSGSALILQGISLPAQTHMILMVNMHLGPRVIYYSALFRCHTDQLHQTCLCCSQYPVALKKRSDDLAVFILSFVSKDLVKRPWIQFLLSVSVQASRGAQLFTFF